METNVDHRKVIALAGVAVLAMAAGAPAADASSQNALADTKWQHDVTGLCLDASVYQGVSVKPCGGAYQDWTFPASGNRMLHKQSLRCLDASVSRRKTHALR